MCQNCTLRITSKNLLPHVKVTVGPLEAVDVTLDENGHGVQHND